MSDSKPVFVFVPGGFQGPPHFGPIVDALGKRGYEAIGLSIPGTGADAATAPPLESVKGVREKIRELVEEKKRDVVLVGCSYGGFVASMSVKGFEKSAERAGGVKRVVFISALVLPEGQIMVASLGGGSLPPWAEMDEQAGFLRPSKICASIFFSDLDEAVQEHWATFFQPVTFKDSLATVVNSCWDVDVPKTYVHTTNDPTNPIEQQEALLKEVMKPRPDDWATERWETDHSPFLSHVDKTADFLVKIAG